MHLDENLQTNVYGSLIHNCQMETTRRPVPLRGHSRAAATSLRSSEKKRELSRPDETKARRCGLLSEGDYEPSDCSYTTLQKRQDSRNGDKVRVCQRKWGRGTEGGRTGDSQGRESDPLCVIRWVHDITHWSQKTPRTMQRTE